MINYLKGCLKENHITPEVYNLSISFWDQFKEAYPSLDLDAAPTGSGFLFAIDNGDHHTDFEVIIEEDQWVCDFFYRNRLTDELQAWEMGKLSQPLSFEKVDRYIQLSS